MVANLVPFKKLKSSSFHMLIPVFCFRSSNVVGKTKQKSLCSKIIPDWRNKMDNLKTKNLFNFYGTFTGTAKPSFRFSPRKDHRGRRSGYLQEFPQTANILCGWRSEILENLSMYGGGQSLVVFIRWTWTKAISPKWNLYSTRKFHLTFASTV